MNLSVEYILNRLREASTWVGIAVFLGMFGLDSDIIARITANAPAVITAIAAVIAIVAPDRFGGHTGLKVDQAATKVSRT
jgi:hypothetical protein